LSTIMMKEDHFGFYVFKVILVGDAAVGKTSLINKYVFNQFAEDYKASIGSNIIIKDLETDDGKKVKLSIWDIAGQQKWEVMRPVYYQRADGVLLIYDVTNKESYDNLFTTWYHEIQTIHQDFKLMILGNKSDKGDLKFEDENALNEKFNPIKIIKTSAKNGENVEKAFIELTKAMIAPLYE